MVRPAGARQLSYDQCITSLESTIGFTNAMDIVFVGSQAGSPVATQSMTGLAPQIDRDRKEIRTTMGNWRGAGYPAGYATITDLRRMDAALTALRPFAVRGDVPALPKYYVQFNSASQQYGYDAAPAVCRTQ